MFVRRMLLLLLGSLLAYLLAGCGDFSSPPSDPTQPPTDYLSNALDWI